MFLTLLVATFAIAAVVSFLVARAFAGPIQRILERLVTERLASAWGRYVRFAIYVVGLSGGVRIFSLERYIVPRGPNEAPLVLDTNRWVLEVYGTVIGTLQSIAWMLLAFFLFALIAYVVLRGFEIRQGRDAGGAGTPGGG